MNQPDLGLKVTELRGLKNMTQEKLAEYCEVSTGRSSASKAARWNRVHSHATA